MLLFIDLMSFLMFLRSDFESGGEVGKVVGTIYSVYLDAVELGCVFLEG